MKVLQVLTNSVVPGCGILEVVNNLDYMCKEEGIEVHYLGFDDFGYQNQTIIGSKERLVNLQTMEYAQNLHNTYHYDVIHIHGAFHHCKVVNSFKLNNPDVKVILTCHTFSDIGRSVFLSRDHVVNCISNDVIIDFINPGSITYFYDKILDDDLKKMFDKYKKNAVSSQNTYIIKDDDREVNKVDENKIAYFGRISKGKGIDEIIRMCILSGLSLDLYGVIDNEYKEELDNYLNSSNNLVYKGFLNSKDLENTIRYYKAVVLTTSSENTSMILIKSLMLGVPAIINPTCLGNNYYINELGLQNIEPSTDKWYRKTINTKAEEFRRVYNNIINLSDDEIHDISQKSRSYFSYDKWKNNILRAYKGEDK